ncbi:MAG TPA: hypothetical protein VKX17_23855 [Planctomycetota bacterium]|nr:hypothetical protein [Planctomycetota bacterium]
MAPKVLLALTLDFPGVSRLPSILSRHGFQVSTFCPPQFLLPLSRFVQIRHACSSDARAAIESLRLHFESNIYDAVILGDDALLEAAAQRADEAWTHALFPIDIRRVPASVLYSKAAFFRTLEPSGLALPRTRIGRDPSDARDAANEIGFPLIFKEERGYAGMGVQRFFDQSTLDQFLAQRTAGAPASSRPAALGAPASSRPGCPSAWLLQSEIQGRIATADVLFDRGLPRLWAFSYALNTRNGTFGPSTVREFAAMPDVEPILKTVGLLTGAHGFVGLDFIHEQPSGRLVLLEMNCRPTAGHALAARAGIDFGKEFAAMLRGEKSSAQNPPRIRPTRVPMFPEDFDRAITDKDWPALFKWICVPWYWRHMPLNDPRVMLRHAGDTWRRFGKWVTRS